MKKRFIFFIFSVILAGGCVHTSVRSEIRVFPVEGKGIPEEVAQKILAQMPRYYSETAIEVGGNGQVIFNFWGGKGNPILGGPVGEMVTMIGRTRQAVFLGVANGLLNSGIDVFSSAAQEYYGRKNQGEFSFGPVIQNN